jgi:hypothetical protein
MFIVYLRNMLKEVGPELISSVYLTVNEHFYLKINILIYNVPVNFQQLSSLRRSVWLLYF